MKKLPKWLREALDLALIWLFFTFVLTVTQVSGDSMMPTLRTGERVLIPKYETWLHRIGIGHFNRGDIVVFKPPANAPSAQRPFLFWKYTPFFIKRVVAIAGDTVTITAGKIYVNGTAVNTPELYTYWQAQNCLDTESPFANSANVGVMQAAQKTITIPAHSYFVVGDNRSYGGSEDSRVFGVVPTEKIAGRAVFVFWPFVRHEKASGGCAYTNPEVKLSGNLKLNWRTLP